MSNRRGMKRIIKSVRMLVPAIEKYAAGRLLQPFGKVGSHARQGLVWHSKAWIGGVRIEPEM